MSFDLTRWLMQPSQLSGNSDLFHYAGSQVPFRHRTLKIILKLTSMLN